MSHLDELKRFEGDVKSSTDLQHKLDQAVLRIKEQDQVRSDGELIVQAAKELGYEISIAALEQLKAANEQLDPAELENVSGGVTHYGICDENYVCNFIYATEHEDEFGHDTDCMTGWHCATITLHTECEDKSAKCWSNYTCSWFISVPEKSSAGRPFRVLPFYRQSACRYIMNCILRK